MELESKKIKSLKLVCELGESPKSPIAFVLNMLGDIRLHTQQNQQRETKAQL